VVGNQTPVRNISEEKPLSTLRRVFVEISK